MNNISIFAGAFGSGKTEISINYAIELSLQKSNIAFVDLDIANPYFRSRTKRKEMEAYGVNVVAPKGGLEYVDIPIILPSVKGYIENRDYVLVMDIGGEDMGARVLGSLKPAIEARGYEFLLVINTFRPFTSDVNSILEMAESIRMAARLNFTGIIANPNLGEETKLKDIVEGLKIIEGVSKKMGLPIKFVVVLERLFDGTKKLNLNIPIFPLKRYLTLPFSD